MALSLKLASRFIFPAGAAALIGFAVLTVSRPSASQPTPPAAPAAASNPSASVVAALGVIEPSTEVIAVATELPGVIREVYVVAGQEVKRGDPLFRLDGREVEAGRRSAVAQLESARARRLGAEAALRSAEAAANDARARYALFDRVSDPRAISQDERDRARFALDRAEAQVAEARASVQQARAAIDEAAARVAEVDTDAARQLVRAPVDGTILRLSARVGEYAQAGPLTEPLIAMGSLSPLHVRLQIDEEDAWRVGEGARAEGSLRGDAERRVQLRFVRFEPQARPKRNLNGGSERVDTRVVEAIYAFEPGSIRAFVGQQMDVFVSATPLKVVQPAPAAGTAR